MTAQTTAPAGSIYDLGYRHYEGKRRGRWYGMWSLFVESLRGVWGLGRPTTAKAAPFALLSLYALPALFQLAFASILSQEMARGEEISLITYRDYYFNMSFFAILFCVAQAPELVCRDQRYHVLPLYFTRTVGRLEYAFARLASLTSALFIVLMVPMVLLFIGDVLMKTDTLQAIGDEWSKALPAVPACVLGAASMASISLAISSFSPRRAYSAIALLAYFLIVGTVPLIIYGVSQEVTGWTWADKLVLLTPDTAIAAATSWFFGAALPEHLPATLGSDTFVLAVLASIAVFTGILAFQYRRVQA
jgi:ABC-2 type transport system permease protein